MIIDLYIYEFTNELKEVKPFFSNYRLNKIKDNNNLDFLKKTIQTEYVLYDLLVNKYNVKNFDFKIKGNGRPILVNEEINFSIAHKDNYLIIGVSEENLSVDIELIDIKRINLKKRLYSKENNYNIEQVIKDFTIKEAFIKYYSESITKDLTLINIDENYVYDKSRKLNYKTIKYSNYFITICSNKMFELNISSV